MTSYLRKTIAAKALEYPGNGAATHLPAIRLAHYQNKSIAVNPSFRSDDVSSFPCDTHSDGPNSFALTCERFCSFSSLRACGNTFSN